MEGLGGWQLANGEAMGAGAFGAIFEVWRYAPGTKVVQRGALKILKNPGDKLAEKLLIAEIETYASLNSAHIPRFQIAGTAVDDSPWFIVEFVDGKNLVEIVKNQGVLSREQALLLAKDVSSGLIEAHGKNLKHLDIKADNIMARNSGGWVLVDFGLSTKQHQEGAGITNQIYSAPEQFTSGIPITPAADIFSLGTTLYYSLTRENPYDVYLPMFYRDAVQSKGPSLSKVSDDLRDLLGSMLHIKPELRPTAQEVNQRVSELITGASAVVWHPDRIKTWEQFSDLIATQIIKGLDFNVHLTQPDGIKSTLRYTKSESGWLVKFSGEVEIGRVISAEAREKLSELKVRMLRSGDYSAESAVPGETMPELSVGIVRNGLEFSLAELGYKVNR
jgi:serine/threonine protein kinase